MVLKRFPILENCEGLNHLQKNCSLGKLFKYTLALVLTSHLRNWIRQQSVELLMGAVPNSTPARRVEVLPDAAQANGHPLAEQRVGVWQLLQAVGY